MWDRFVQDARFAVRMLARAPLLTAAIVSTLALGIGVASAVFSLLQAVVLRPLPYDAPDELVQVYETGPRPGGEADWVAFPNFRDWQQQNRVFDGLAAYRYALLTLAGREGAESMLGLEATGELFRVLRVQPVIGRTFRPGEHLPGRDRVAVLSHALWQRRFGADPRVIGRAVTVEGVAHTIVGVMPASFRFPQSIPGDTIVPIDLWIPMRPSDELQDRHSHNFWAVGRLKPGITLQQARTAMRTIADNLARAHPESNKDFSVSVVPLDEYVAGNLRPALLVLLGAVALVLLLTCANIANLLLSRAQARRREMAVRQAVGAGRGRLMRQMLTESLLLALGGGALGVAVAHAGTRLLVSLGPPNIPRLEQTTVDGHVLAFMAVVSVTVGILFGVAPALLTSQAHAHTELKDTASRVSEGRAARHVRQALVTGQIALAIMLLVGAGLLVRSFAQVTGLDLGFRPPHVLTAFINLPPARYGDPARQAEFFEDAIRRVERLPGVVAAAVSNSVPLTGVNDQGGLMIEGLPNPWGNSRGDFYANRPRVSPRYFEVMGIRLLSGRSFDSRDRKESLPVAIVSDLAVRTYWPGVDPLGRRVAVEWVDRQPIWRQVVGVVQSTGTSAWKPRRSRRSISRSPRLRRPSCSSSSAPCRIRRRSKLRYARRLRQSIRNRASPDFRRSKTCSRGPRRAGGFRQCSSERSPCWHSCLPQSACTRSWRTWSRSAGGRSGCASPWGATGGRRAAGAAERLAADHCRRGIRACRGSRALAHACALPVRRLSARSRHLPHGHCRSRLRGRSGRVLPSRGAATVDRCSSCATNEARPRR